MLIGLVLEAAVKQRGFAVSAGCNVKQWDASYVFIYYIKTSIHADNGAHKSRMRTRTLTETCIFMSLLGCGVRAPTHFVPSVCVYIQIYTYLYQYEYIMYAYV